MNELLPYQDISMGLIVFSGIDEYEKELLHLIKPKIQLNTFYYNCGNKFITYIAEKYTNEHKGNIIFANGNNCIIYEFLQGKFVVKKHFNALLQKRQKKGGQSALRIGRLAEESRHTYIIKVIDYVNILERDCKSVLFGSEEITSMIMTQKTLLCPLVYGGFLEFNLDTIKNTDKWIEYLKPNNDSKYDDKYKLILECLNIKEKIDRLDFSLEKSSEMEFCVTSNKNILKSIPFPSISSKYYEKLKDFEYIGVKYFSYVCYNDNDNDNYNDNYND